ncbi:CBO0543 family protein [Desulfosporosinus fructosivorans]|uniref:CBO0543 family protein n=1 Tax=Desulfosporosinus fructosivorans TaxID=2018669 RepID=UPI003B84830F
MILIILQHIIRPAKAILLILICLKWGDWRNWRKYYPTILYVIIWDLLYNFFTVNHPLWRFEHPVLKHTFSDLLIAFVSFPCYILLFLPYIPKESRVKKILHIANWAFILSLLEATSIPLQSITYHNGWNYWWSVGFNVTMFSMISLHYKNPLLAWPISALLFLVVMIIFKLPLSSLL